MDNRKIVFTSYNSEKFERIELLDLHDLVILQDNNVKWLEIATLDDIDLVNRIVKKFNIHPLVLEDILSIDHIPKVEDYQDYLFLIVEGMNLNDNGELEVEQFAQMIFFMP